MKTMKKNAGFTLFELLVVISIIALIIAVGTASYSSAQKRARDAKRRQDLQAIQKSFEQYYAVNGDYPAVGEGGDAMPGWPPTDPKNADTYVYTGVLVIADDNYCICANLETDTGNASDTSCTFVTGGNQEYYCVEQLQE